MIFEVPECAAMNSSSGCSTKSDTRCRLAAGSSGIGGGAWLGSVGAPGAADGASRVFSMVQLEDQLERVMWV